MATSKRSASKRAAAAKTARTKRPAGAKKAARTKKPAGAKKAARTKPTGVKRAARTKKPTGRRKTAGAKKTVGTRAAVGPGKAAAAKRAAPAKEPAGGTKPAHVTQLQQDLSRAHRDLEIRTAELEAAQARFTELEQRLRLIHESRPYRIAWKAWRIREKARAPFSRNRLGAARRGSGQDGAADEGELALDGPDEVLYAAGYTEVSSAPLANAATGQVGAAPSTRDFEQEYHGSRGVRAVDPGQAGPLRPVLLLGLSEARLDKALRALNGSGPAEPAPLIITDCDALRMLDASGYLYEYVPPREDWEQRLGRDERGYDEFLRRRLASIAGMYELTDLPTQGLVPAT